MHEFTLGETRGVAGEVDAAVALELRRTREAISHRGLLLWAEHCTECAMPDCFATCSLYTPRPDLKCRRFSEGIRTTRVADAAGGPLTLMSIAFRRWGKLEASGRVGLVSAGTARLIEGLSPTLARMVDLPVLPPAIRRKACKAGDKGREALARRAEAATAPDHFVLEVIADGDEAVDLTLTIKAAVGRSSLYQGRARAEPGYNRFLFPAADILSRIDATGACLFQIEPMALKPGVVLRFGLVDFVALKPGAALEATSPAPRAAPKRAEAGAKAPKIKCVVWDLDNTMWAGTLVEDGPDNLRLNAKAAALVVELDRRGILNSIASKNTEEAARAVLERFGLAEYFLFPQIHWQPKSRSIDAIAAALNIGSDTFAFIDDQPFERAEVQRAHPEVEVFDVDTLDSLIQHERLDVPVTAESGRRRAMYQVEQGRMAVLDDLGGDYVRFLRECRIELTVSELDAQNINRAFELTERTNQLNYSGRRLSRNDLEAIMTRPEMSVLVLAVRDQFGDYGVIGVALLDLEHWRVECFFMSCRVQRKTVENAFFQHLLDVGRARGHDALVVDYTPTAKNEPSRVVLEDELRFMPGEETDGRRVYRLPTSARLDDADVVTLVDSSRLTTGDARVLARA